MHLTAVKLKNGETFQGYIIHFKPERGWMELNAKGEMRCIQFSDIESAITEGVRQTTLKMGHQNELNRAKNLLREARKFGWFGMNKDTPLQEWEND